MAIILSVGGVHLRQLPHPASVDRPGLIRLHLQVVLGPAQGALADTIGFGVGDDLLLENRSFPQRFLQELPGLPFCAAAVAVGRCHGVIKSKKNSEENSEK